MHMNDDNQLMRTGLEEEMLDIAEKDIHMLILEWRLITQPVLMNFHFTGNSFSVEWWPKIDVRQLDRSAIYRQLANGLNREKHEWHATNF